MSDYQQAKASLVQLVIRDNPNIDLGEATTIVDQFCGRHPGIAEMYGTTEPNLTTETKNVIKPPVTFRFILRSFQPLTAIYTGVGLLLAFGLSAVAGDGNLFYNAVGDATVWVAIQVLTVLLSLVLSFFMRNRNPKL